MARSKSVAASPAPTDLRRLAFLVVEDHEFQRSMIVKMLNGLGARSVASAPDGLAALACLKELPSKTDVVVSDLDMPMMDGMEFMRHLGAQWPGISLIVASALGRDLLASIETMATAYGVHFLGVIEKPVTPRKLEELLTRHPRAPQRLRSRHTEEPVFGVEEIAAAIDSNEFEAYFQPKIEIATSRIVGAEALARWKHSRHGIVLPYSFVSALEESGRIDMLMRCILRQAARISRELHERGLVSVVCVNVSLKSLHDVTLADQITDIIRGENVDPKDVVLEITESAATTDIGKALENLTRLRMKGFGLAIDDYGTGYSSLEQLARLPFTELKIDQAFVTHAGQRESTKVILGSSLEMARRLKLLAVAEGVESRENWDLLAELKCDVAQGYFIAQPMPAAAYLDWCHDWPQMAMH